ncbi:MAG: biotin-dependent carboxyltransferase family protein [Verrucomicrobiota bacterium]|nr:biotin-dependent carboxyltransferase family protein [Verrucomicrobiota bacterium]
MIVVSAGFQTTVQDLGRFGFRKFGVGVTGALDSAALRLCNSLVGNDEDAAGLEIGSGRVTLRVDDTRLVAWSGGDFDVRIADSVIPRLHCARLTADTIMELRANELGRAWIAISGGIDVDQILGSRATDLRAGFGGNAGRILRDGDLLPLGEMSPLARNLERSFPGRTSSWSAPIFPRGHLRVVPGKDWTDAIGAKFLRTQFRVAANSDRMGLRLEGAQIASADSGELVSEPVAPGTVQLPRGGGPIVLLADCQTIGGYPKIAHVISVDLPGAAQLHPGDRLSFARTTLEHARELWLERERDIALFRAGLQARFG